MSTSKPVVVYGASGYTGRLDRRVPAGVQPPVHRRRPRRGARAGRDGPRPRHRDRRLRGRRRSSTRVEALTELFSGAQVVCNTVGPFATYGAEVVEACIAAGCHYLDTNGEQDWIDRCDEEYGAADGRGGPAARRRASRRCTRPARSRPRSPGDAGARHARHRSSSGRARRRSPRPQTIFVNAALAKAHYLEQNQYVEWPADGTIYERRGPRPARDRAGAAMGRHLAPGVVQARPARRQRQARSAGCSTAR